MNATLAFLDTHVASGRGDRIAVSTPAGEGATRRGDAELTYRELLVMANRMGTALRERGVARDARVAMLLPDGPAFAATFFGALRIGAVAVPLNPRLAAAEHVSLLRDCEAIALVIDGSLGDTVQGGLTAVPSLRSVVVAMAQAGETPAPTAESRPLDARVELLDRVLAAASPELAPQPVDDDAMAFWLYTSGTTGRPKAAVHLHRDLLACRHYGDAVLGVTAEDRVFSTSKLFFAYALGNALLIPLFAAARTCLDPVWTEPERVHAILREFQPTLFFSVPTFYARLLRAGWPPTAFASVRACVSAGERLPPHVYHAFRDRFGVEILDGIGATETIFMVLSNRPGLSRAGSSGIPVPATDVRLLDAAGEHVADGTQGVLHVKAPSASGTYWNLPSESERAFHDGWFRTGDVYYRDAAGYYFHCGREDDFFKVAGMWVVPGDVEAVLLTHPDVLEAGVVGAEDAGGLVKPFAFVVGRAGSTTRLVEELAATIEGKLAPHQRPRAIFVVSELPRTTTGKLKRHELRAAVERRVTGANGDARPDRARAC